MKKKLLKTLLCATFCSILFSCNPQKDEMDDKQYKIIDVHLHSDWWGEPNKVAWNRKEFVAQKDEKTFIDSTFWYIEKYNFVKVITDGNNALAFAKREPNKIIPAIGGVGESIDSLRKWFLAGKYKVMAEFSPQYSGLAPNDAQLDKYYSLAEELKIPIGMHIGLGPPGAAYLDSKNYKMNLSKAILLEDVLIKHPNLKIYVMHAGWPYLDDIIALLYAHPQVYVDVAVINWFIPKAEFHSYLRRIVEAGFADRVMYGSDQMIWPQSIKTSVENIKTADFLTKQQKEDIFYNNAARFFQLEK